MAEHEAHQRMLNRAQKPTETDIFTFISNAEAISAWNQIQDYLETHYDLLKETIYYGDKYGWLVRYRKSGRTIVSLFPEKNSFSFLIVYGKKEIDKFSAQESEFLPTIIDVFQNTTKLHDGKWLWIQITDSTFFEDLKKIFKRFSGKPISMKAVLISLLPLSILFYLIKYLFQIGIELMFRFTHFLITLVSIVIKYFYLIVLPFSTQFLLFFGFSNILHWSSCL